LCWGNSAATKFSRLDEPHRPRKRDTFERDM
jgi:hypothetical protein